MNGLSEETIETIMEDYLAGKGHACILRRIEVTDDEETPPAPVRAPGIFGRIKQLFQQN